MLSKLKPSSLSTSASPAGSGSFWILPEGLSAAVRAGREQRLGCGKGFVTTELLFLFIM